MPLHLNDIINNKFNKPVEEVSAKSLDLKKLETPKAISIRIDRTVTVTDGTRTNYVITVNHNFTSTTELQEVLNAVGYNQKKGILHRVWGWLMEFRK